MQKIKEETRCPETIQRTEIPIGGLCLDCRRQNECSVEGRVNVQQCEMWEGDPRIKNPVLRTEEIEVQTPIGLCVNCERLGECRFAATEGGVWYCEEYC